MSTHAAGAVLLGIGTAMVYPTLMAAIADVTHPSWRARAIGIYRLWRDLGYAGGAVAAGVLADAIGLRGAVWTVAAVTLASGLVVAVRMREKRPPRHSAESPADAAQGTGAVLLAASRTAKAR
jgi:MFS family permease